MPSSYPKLWWVAVPFSKQMHFHGLVYRVHFNIASFLFSVRLTNRALISFEALEEAVHTGPS